MEGVRTRRAPWRVVSVGVLTVTEQGYLQLITHNLLIERSAARHSSRSSIIPLIELLKNAYATILHEAIGVLLTEFPYREV